MNIHISDKYLRWLLYTLLILAIFYVGLKTYKELKPKSLTERKLHCLELGSDARAVGCLQLLK